MACYPLHTLFLSSPRLGKRKEVQSHREEFPSFLHYFLLNVESTHPALIILQCLSLFLPPPTQMISLSAWGKMIDIIHYF